MNKQRRKRIMEAIDYIIKVKEIINEVMEEEEDAFNNLSEGLQCTTRGEQMENNISEMEEAISKIEDVIENLDNIY